MMEIGFTPDFFNRVDGTGTGKNASLRRQLNPMRSQLVSETLTTEPVSLVTVKNFLRITTTNEDTILLMQEIAVRRWLERYLNIDLTPKVWNIWQNANPEGRQWFFPKNPVTALNAVYYWDLSDTQNLWPQVGNYQVNLLDTMSSFFLEVGAVWPYVTRLNDAWQVNFNSGYDNVTNITPEPLQQAILFMLDDWYNNRGQISDNTTIHMSHAIKSMIEPYKNPGTII